jgi:acyl-CoA thioesterase-1
MKLVCFGDSITFGYGVKKEDSWVKILEDKYKIQIENRGINGDTTAGMLSRSYKDIIMSSPTHTIIMGGTNDFLCGRKVNQVSENICFILKECIYNKITPLLAIQPPIAKEKASVYWSNTVNYEEVNNNIFEYRNLIIKFAEEHNIEVIDFYSAFINLPNSTLNNLFIDGVHPTKEGHLIMANMINLFECN